MLQLEEDLQVQNGVQVDHLDNQDSHLLFDRNQGIGQEVGQGDLLDDLDEGDPFDLQVLEDGVPCIVHSPPAMTVGSLDNAGVVGDNYFQGVLDIDHGEVGNLG